MQKRSLIFIILLLNSFVYSAEDIDPVVKTFIHKYSLALPDGREILISQPARKQTDINKKRVFLRKNKDILWDRTYGTGNDNLVWWDAYFMPVVSGKFIYDVDSDGIPEVAIGTWHGGNDVTSCTAFIFSIKDDALIMKGQKRINYEFSRSVY